MKDFALELGCLGFTMRLKRISDAMMQDGKRMYKQLDIDIEPNWYIIFRLLKKEGEMTVTEIADRIQLAHTSVITLTNKMIKADYITSTPCHIDTRRRYLDLSQKAVKKLPELEQIWDAGEKAVIEALAGTEVMSALSLIEERFNEKGFRERTIEILNTSK
jgi:DNA-binding MarR family transcriptional regulator